MICSCCGQVVEPPNYGIPDFRSAVIKDIYGISLEICDSGYCETCWSIWWDLDLWARRYFPEWRMNMGITRP